ncbi:MAG: protein kinase [Oscillospiraceae bacterium]|nr:protein kinase [Oscillospiraceae bacterium]
MEQNRCPGCMNIKSGAVCEHCGYDERRQNAPHQLQIGTALQDRYLVGRALGQGGFGITYLGWNRYLEKKVAIKEYYPAIFVDRNATYDTTVVCRTEQMEEFFAENRMRFLREAKTLAKLEEVPQIVSILDFFEANNTAYIVMEYLQGSDLRAYVKKKGGCLSPTETFNIMRPVMAALVKVHEAGLVHRDISPDNIMLQYDGSVKLMDFGAVRSVNNAAVDKELTQATQAIVKHGFAPVEQYSAKGSIGPWTDEYALCATMYYCMTGKVPENVHDRIDEDKDIDWDTVAGLTDRQKEILQKGMAIRAKDRHHDIRQLMEALFAQPAPKPEPPKPEPPKPQPPTPKKPGKKKMFLLLGVVLALVLALGIGIGFGGGVKEQDGSALKDTPTMAPTEVPTEAPMEPQQETVYAGFQQSTISAASFHTVGLKEDGTVVAAGVNDVGQCKVSGWRDIVAVSAGAFHTVGLKEDGTVVAVGQNTDGDCNVSGWQNIVAISTGDVHTVGLKEDGTVVAVGRNDKGQCDVSGWRDIVAIGAGENHTVGLKADGTVVVVGANDVGQCNVSGWRDIVAVSAGKYHTVGLKADGTVVAVGSNDVGQCNVSDWRDIVAVSVGNWHIIGLKSDGTVVAAGADYDERCKVSGWTDIVAISASSNHTVGLKADGTMVAVGYNDYEQCNVSDWRDIKRP